MNTPSANTRPCVGVCILNWNKPELTQVCVQSVAEAAARLDGADLRIYVLDNGSEAAHREKLGTLLQGRVHRLSYASTNQGFARGQNLLARQALADGCDYLWVLNNDAKCELDTIAQLLAFLDTRPDVGAVSPLVCEQKGAETSTVAWGVVDWLHCKSAMYSTEAAALDHQRACGGDVWISGAAMFLRGVAFQAVGGFDEDFFAYFEDNDICVRLQRSHWNCAVATLARVHHQSHADHVKERGSLYFYLMYRNAFKFWLSHHLPKASRHALAVKWQLLQEGTAMACRLWRQGYASKCWACLNGVIDGWAGRFGVPTQSMEKPQLIGRFWLWFSLRRTR